MAKWLRIWPILIVIFLLVVPYAVQSQEAGPIYVVQPGDTLSGIARRFGISQEALIEANGIADPSRLFPGQQLLLPGFPGIEGELTLRTLVFGETIQSLSQDYHLDPVALARLNRMSRLDSAYVGQRIIVPVVAGDGGDQPDAFRRLVEPGDTRLTLAVKGNFYPWQITPAGEGELRIWQLPGTLSLDPAAGDTTAWPSMIKAADMNPSPLIQGKTTVLHVDVPEGYRVSGKLGDRPVPFFQDSDGRWVGLQGVHALTEPGLMDLRIEVTTLEAEDPLYGFSQRVLVEEGDYGFQVLSGVPPETVDPANTRPEEDLVQALLAPRTETKLWDGPFDYPSQYFTDEFISVFGTRRNYNNGALLYYHTGVDFYGQNVPIYAPADGTVIFADFLTIRGKVTYIDHGWGVYSGYLHQEEISVQAGERVERGQEIGLVGATGRVTGPHLHWEIWVGGVPVDPLDWVTKTIP